MGRHINNVELCEFTHSTEDGETTTSVNPRAVLAEVLSGFNITKGTAMIIANKLHQNGVVTHTLPSGNKLTVTVLG